jgi:UDP-N-acetylglucosamine 2-epimerase (non-hydrolysing)
MKVAPLHRAFRDCTDSIRHLVCHTGQHYDDAMSNVFLQDLDLPNPDFNLGVGSGSHATQTAAVMVEFEKVLIANKPDLVLVVGDVNSTIACALVSVKLHIPVGHIEAGLRSFDRSMPEEINRILTDAIADLLFVSEPSGITNLSREGVAEERVHYVGNVMIDSLVYALPKIAKSRILEELGIIDPFVLVTLHRPSNVDTQPGLQSCVRLLENIASLCHVVFPIHPRTQATLHQFDFADRLARTVQCLGPLRYVDFMRLLQGAAVVVTDSGGIQEESTFLGVPCITLRESTERPITIQQGTNVLTGSDFQRAYNEAKTKILERQVSKKPTIDLWDGNAASRIKAVILHTLG